MTAVSVSFTGRSTGLSRSVFRGGFRGFLSAHCAFFIFLLASFFVFSTRRAIGVPDFAVQRWFRGFLSAHCDFSILLNFRCDQSESGFAEPSRPPPDRRKSCAPSRPQGLVGQLHGVDNDSHFSGMGCLQPTLQLNDFLLSHRDLVPVIDQAPVAVRRQVLGRIAIEVEQAAHLDLKGGVDSGDVDYLPAHPFVDLAELLFVGGIEVFAPRRFGDVAQGRFVEILAVGPDSHGKNRNACIPGGVGRVSGVPSFV